MTDGAFGAVDSREEEVRTGPWLWKAMIRDWKYESFYWNILNKTGLDGSTIQWPFPLDRGKSESARANLNQGKARDDSECGLQFCSL